MEEKKKYGKFENYEIEHLADKMIAIEKCKEDKEKMGYVLEALKEKQDSAKKVISSIEDLKKAHQGLSEKEEEDGDGEYSK